MRRTISQVSSSTVRSPAFLSNRRFLRACALLNQLHGAICRKSEAKTSFRICLVQSFSSFFKVARCAFSWAIGSAGAGGAGSAAPSCAKTASHIDVCRKCTLQMMPGRARLSHGIVARTLGCHSTQPKQASDLYVSEPQKLIESLHGEAHTSPRIRVK